MFKRMANGQTVYVYSQSASKDPRPSLPIFKGPTCPSLTPSSLLSQNDMTIKLTNAIKRKRKKKERKKKAWQKFFNKGSTNDPERNKMRQRSWKERDAGMKQVHIVNTGKLDISKHNSQGKMNRHEMNGAEDQGRGGRSRGIEDSGLGDDLRNPLGLRRWLQRGRPPFIMVSGKWFHILRTCSYPSY